MDSVSRENWLKIATNLERSDSAGSWVLRPGKSDCRGTTGPLGRAGWALDIGHALEISADVSVLVEVFRNQRRGLFALEGIELALDAGLHLFVPTGFCDGQHLLKPDLLSLFPGLIHYREASGIHLDAHQSHPRRDQSISRAYRL